MAWLWRSCWGTPGSTRGTAQEEQLWLQTATGLEELHRARAEPNPRHCRAEIQPPKQAPHVGHSPRSDACDANQVTTPPFVFRNIELVNNKNRKEPEKQVLSDLDPRQLSQDKTFSCPESPVLILPWPRDPELQNPALSQAWIFPGLCSSPCSTPRLINGVEKYLGILTQTLDAAATRVWKHQQEFCCYINSGKTTPDFSRGGCITRREEKADKQQQIFLMIMKETPFYNPLPLSKTHHHSPDYHNLQRQVTVA